MMSIKSKINVFIVLKGNKCANCKAVVLLCFAVSSILGIAKHKLANRRSNKIKKIPSLMLVYDSNKDLID